MAPPIPNGATLPPHRRSHCGTAMTLLDGCNGPRARTPIQNIVLDLCFLKPRRFISFENIMLDNGDASFASEYRS